MYAFVKNPDGTYYSSPVFGHYCKITSTDPSQRRKESIDNRFYIVLNREGNRLVKRYAFERDPVYLRIRTFLIDIRQDGWILDENGYGCVEYLRHIDFEADDWESQISASLLETCCQVGKNEPYREYVDVETDWDLQNFVCVTSGLHDASIETVRIDPESDTLYLLFDISCWHMNVEMWFTGDVLYAIPDHDDPYWYDCTFKKYNDFFYLLDEDDLEFQQIRADHTWFMAKKVRYRILPI